MKKFLSLIFGLSLLFPTTVSANLIIYPPPYPIIETSQKAVIWYEAGIETLILSTTFRGNAKDFGWLIPVPAKPEVDKASDELFTALEDLTRPKVDVDRGPLDIPLGITGLEEKRLAPAGPTVIETKEVDIFDIIVLDAKNQQGLTDWLSRNGYSYPADRDHIIKSYIEQNWYFVAVKVNSGALGFAQTALRDGHATPLKITFPTSQIIYPIRLSGPGIPVSSSSDTKVAAYSFEQGVEGFFASPFQDTGVSSQQLPRTDKKTLPRVNLNLDPDNSYRGTFSLKVVPVNTASQTFAARTSLSNLKPGKTYTISAWAKSINPQTGSVFLSLASGSTTEQSDKKSTTDLANWQRLTKTFTAPAVYATIELTGTNFSEGETVNWDAVQIEEGSKSTEFAEEVLPTTPKASQQLVDQVTVLFYVFSNHKKELPGFTTSYAGWISPKTTEKLAFASDGKQPWIKAQNRMYLTKLHRQMKPSEATTDLILRDAANNDPVNAESFPEVSTVRFFAVIILILAAEVGGLVWFVKFRRRKTNVPSS